MKFFFNIKYTDNMTTLFIRYKDVCNLANLNNEKVLKKLHSQKKFKEAFQLIFNFKDNFGKRFTRTYCESEAMLRVHWEPETLYIQ